MLNTTDRAAAGHDVSSGSERRFDFLLTLLYALGIGWLTIRHELWPDEVQQWLIAHDSHGLNELFHNRRYEGHPLVWYLILYPFAHLSDNVEAIKPINFVLSCTAAYLTIRYLLKTKYEKILFLLAPLQVFYYAVVARPYMLGYLVLILVLLAARQPRRMLTIFLLLGLLANVHVYFLLIAGCFLVYYLLVLGLPGRIGRMPPRFWLGLCACLFLFALCLWQVVPPDDYSSRTDYRPASIANAFALYSLAMWPSLGAQPGFLVFLLLLAPYLYLSRVALRLTPHISIFLLASTLGMLMFQSLYYGGSAWHAGIVYVCILAAIFLMRDSIPPAAEAGRTVDLTLLYLLCLHAASGLILLHSVVTTPCSIAKYAAAFVRDECTAGCTVISDQQFDGVSISGYLGGQPVFYVNRQEFGTYALLDSKHFLPHGMDDVARAGHRFDNPIMLTNLPATPDQRAALHLRLLRSFSGSMVPDERYFIYVFDTTTTP